MFHLFSLIGIGNYKIKEALKKGALVIDVRTAYEFDQGHVPASINIPVDRIKLNAARIKKMNRPVIFCGSLDSRSNTAAQILKTKGVKEVYNGGSWQNVMKILDHI